MIKKVLAWAVLVAMVVGIAAFAVFLWNACRLAACVLIGVMAGIAFAFLLVWALETVGWL